MADIRNLIPNPSLETPSTVTEVTPDGVRPRVEGFTAAGDAMAWQDPGAAHYETKGGAVLYANNLLYPGSTTYPGLSTFPVAVYAPTITYDGGYGSAPYGTRPYGE